jgi:hypothetical protein
MSMLSAAEQDGTDVFTVETTAPRPRAAAPSSAAGGRTAPAAARPSRRAAQPAAPAGQPARARHVRRVRVSDVRVRELRAGDDVRAREVRGAELRSVTVRSREIRRSVPGDGPLQGAGPVRGDSRRRDGVPGGGSELRRRPVSAAEPGVSGAGRAGRVRLTRRGRAVLAAFAIAVATAAVTLFWLSAAGGAQAASHGGPGGARRGLAQVVVQPGQTLWSIARRAEPAADPRIVVQQIIEVNALSGVMIQPGQLLWVPKG